MIKDTALAIVLMPINLALRIYMFKKKIPLD